MQPLKRPPADLVLLLALLAVVVAIAVTLPGCAAIQNTVPAAPERFRGPAPIVYLQAGAVAQECGNPLYSACAIPMPEGVAGPDWRIVTPNPCSGAYSGEAYARLVCHELAHAQGWSKEHERK